MKTSRRLLTLASLMLATGSLLPLSATAQGAYPNRPIKFVVPYAAGGLPDTVARIFAQRLGDKLGSHRCLVDGESGIWFAVWAPSAESVSVVGTFNAWNKSASPLARGGNFRAKAEE